MFSLIFNFYIVYQDDETLKEHFYKINIIPSKNIKIEDSKFNLCSIIVYKNMHYTCYFMCANQWYYYDDTALQTIKFVGEYDDLLKHKPSPKKNGILYFTQDLSLLNIFNMFPQFLAANDSMIQ